MSDPHWDKVVFLSGFEGGSPVDESPLAGAVTVYGTTANSAAQAKFGTQSLAFPAVSGDPPAGISTPAHASMAIGTQSWTAECWVRFSSLIPSTYRYTLLSQNQEFTGTGCSWRLQIWRGASAGQFYLTVDVDELADGSGDTAFATSSSNQTSYAVDTWYHVAVDYDGVKYRLYVDGVMVGSDDYIIATTATSDAPMGIGTMFSDGSPPTYESAYDCFIDEARVTIGAARYATDTSFTVPAEAFPRTGPDPNDVEILDGVNFFDNLAPTQFETVAESVSLSSTLVVSRPENLSDTVRAFAYIFGGNRVSTTLTDTVTVDLTLGALNGVVLLDRIGVLETYIANSVTSHTLVDTARLTDLLRSSAAGVLTETVVWADSALAQQAVRIIDTLGLTPTLIGSGKYARSLSDITRLVDSLGRFFGAEMSDTLEIAPTLGVAARMPGVLSDTANLSDDLTPKLLLKAVLGDTVELAHTQLLNAILNGVVIDGVEITGGLLMPDGGLVTWAMNTRIGAVTEYGNYNFNSFARMGRRYLGASADGLYELLGDTDDGADIVTHLKSGYMQFGGTQLSRLKEAYIAARGEGDFVLRIVTGDGVTYNYATSTRDMRSTRVHMGKGQRARYFAFELISEDGHDFDLDTLEFVPIVVQRRV